MKFWGSAVLFFLIVYIVGLLRNSSFYVFQSYSYIAHIFFSFYIAGWIIQLTKEIIFTTKIDIRNKAVLVTGCDSGFGNYMAKRFDKIGFTVFACCLDPTGDGAKSLENTCSNKLKILEMNVTSDTSVNNAVALVKQSLQNQKLWAIVNNAGIYKGFQTELSHLKDYEDCLQVNALGMVRVTKACLPLLRKSHGRVVNICSMAGRVCVPWLSAYSMSKHAAVAYSESIMYELREFGIRVISVEPEFFRTNICTNLMETLNSSLETIPEEIRNDYGDKYIASAINGLQTVFEASSPKIENVIDAVESAVTLQYPADVYKPCRNTWIKLFFFVGERVPRELHHPFYIIFSYILGVKKTKTGKDNIVKLLSL